MNGSSPALIRLESEIAPIEVINRLRIPVRIQGDHSVCACPSCHQDMVILPHAVVCSNEFCKLCAAGPLELAAQVKRSFPNGLNWLLEQFALRLQSWMPTVESPTFKECIRSALGRRRVFDFFLNLRDKQHNQEAFDLTALSKTLQRWNYRKEAHGRSIFALGTKRTRELADLLSRCGYDASEIEPEASIVIPWFTGHHQIGMLSLLTIRKQKACVINVKLTPSRYMLAGLLDIPPRHARVWVSHHFAQTMTTREQILTRFPGEHVAAIAYAPEEDHHGYLPDSMVYVVDPADSGALAGRLSQEHIECSYVSGDELDQAVPLSWVDWLIDRCLRVLRTEKAQLPTRIKILAQSADLSPAQKHRVIRSLAVAGYPMAATQMERIFQTSILFSSSKFKILATPHGYMSIRANQTLRETVANFTIDLRSNILFPERNEIWHKGTLNFNGDAFPIIVGLEDLDNPTAMQKQVQSSFLQNATPAQRSMLPVIRDRTLFKSVSVCLRESMVGLPCQNGISQLGWHPSGSQFITPCWQLTGDGVTSGPFSIYPNMPTLTAFASRKPVFSSKIPFTPPAGACDLVRMILAGMCRSFLHMRMEGVPIRQDRNTQDNLEALFACLGQVRPINFNGPEPIGIGRYPIFGYGYRAPQLRQTDAFVFGIGEHGMPLADLGTLTEPQIRELAAWINHLTLTLGEHLMTVGGAGLERQPSILFTNELIKEGQVLLETILGYQDLPTCPVRFEAMERFFQDIGDPMHIPDFFAYDHQHQAVRLFHRRIPHTSAADLELELRRLAPTVEVHPDYLTATPSAVYALLQHYFSTEVRIPELA